MRGLIDKQGEQFGYVIGNVVYTLEDEATGRLQEGFIVDAAGNKVWRVIGDGVYSLDGDETIGYLSEERPQEYDF